MLENHHRKAFGISLLPRFSLLFMFNRRLSLTAFLRICVHHVKRCGADTFVAFELATNLS